MFLKTVCEEIVSEEKITLVFSSHLPILYGNKVSKDKEIVKLPRIYLDEFSARNGYPMLTGNKPIIFRLHDIIRSQTNYLLYDKDKIKNPFFDTDLIQYMYEAAKQPNYILDIWTNHQCTVINKTKYLETHIILPRSDQHDLVHKHYEDKDYFMNRDYRIQLNLIHKISLLSNYEEELYTTDQEG